MNRNVTIAISVVVFHIAMLWALQTGLLRRTVEVFVPAEILSEFIEPPAPKIVPPPPPPPKPVKQPVAKAPLPVPALAPQPLAIADPTPSPNAPTGVTTPQPITPPVAAPVAVAPPAAARDELPSSDADYLQNPKPPYPALSKRLGEQGKVMVRVLISQDGTAQKADIKQSSGFERLDQAALATVLRWRYVPGKRAGVPETMWFNVPINFVLE
ncbi:energy transducer TonB [Rhodoferax sp. UBA5149]|uniref:energy transducer TonB n=1 Tax=Rhodoferax sp. UBA5149 TaxID=1947379 RepID=UPI0025F9F3A7|nr:TonB family protein [Rhodoferax sp. UBA5149]